LLKKNKKVVLPPGISATFFKKRANARAVFGNFLRLHPGKSNSALVALIKLAE
jgi:hypothetical protein